MAGKRKISTGQKFGRWTVIKANSKCVNNHTYSLCRCQCGTEKEVLNQNLISGQSVSCGCYNRQCASERMREYATTHGQRHTRLYEIWKNMKKRALGKARRDCYFDRGIGICSEWLKFEPFYNWSVANGYKDDLTIDRIDNNKGYEPSNCRWTDKITQANNTRANRFITYHGQTKTIAEWGRELNVLYATVRRRAIEHRDLLTGGHFWE